MIQRVHFVEAVKHPWRLDMAKVVDGPMASETQGYNGFVGMVVFTETPLGIFMDGFRRRLVQPGEQLAPQIRVFSPWANIKWCEHGPAVQPETEMRAKPRERAGATAQ